MPTPIDPKIACQNRILAALSPAAREALLPHMERVSLKMKELLYDMDQPIIRAYFPLSGVMSMVSTTDNGNTVEVATIGNEGVIGLPLFLRSDSIPLKTFAQIPGESLAMKARDFQEAVRNVNGELNEVLHRYTLALFNQIAQHAACSGMHSIEERCARWLLMTHDRVGQDEFPLTQEFLAQMLGVRRASVTVAAGMLQKAGLITYARGVITILNREGLEAASCEHYGLIKKEYDRLLPLK
jgi:CRP-like cAMP-binding protein